jgi:hypothetical protein
MSRESGRVLFVNPTDRYDRPGQVVESAGLGAGPCREPVTPRSLGVPGTRTD